MVVHIHVQVYAMEPHEHRVVCRTLNVQGAMHTQGTRVPSTHPDKGLAVLSLSLGCHLYQNLS